MFCSFFTSEIIICSGSESLTGWCHHVSLCSGVTEFWCRLQLVFLSQASVWNSLLPLVVIVHVCLCALLSFSRGFSSSCPNNFHFLFCTCRRVVLCSEDVGAEHGGEAEEPAEAGEDPAVEPAVYRRTQPAGTKAPAGQTAHKHHTSLYRTCQIMQSSA